MMRGTLFVLSGASGSGKTTLLNLLLSQSVEQGLRVIRAPKYSERQRRGDDDDIQTVLRMTSRDFDIAYVINNVKYGIRLAEIEALMSQGFSPVIILSDFRVVRELKERFAPDVRAIYISSTIDPARLRRIQEERLGFRPDDDQKRILSYHFARVSAAAQLGWWDRVSQCLHGLERDWHSYASDAQSTEIRSQRIRAFHIRYIDHIALFDHVILNYGESRPEEMVQQAVSILKSAATGRRRPEGKPPIFVLVASSGAGKATLMEMLNLIGTDRITITSKLAMRAPKPEDGQDGMIALQRGPEDIDPEVPAWWSPDIKEQALVQRRFPDVYDIRWKFHGNTEYAISSQEVSANLTARRAQIFASNMGQFEVLRSHWPENAVFLYLHRLISPEEHRQWEFQKWADNPTEAESRTAERERVHREYLERAGEFQHVLLNTQFKEDLYDQMFSLITYYRLGLLD